MYVCMYVGLENTRSEGIAQNPSVPLAHDLLATPSSPTWHRRLRLRRSQSRRRVRLAKFLGIPPRRRDLLRLSKHHTAPPDMGRGWQKGNRHRGSQQDDRSKRWDYWPGAWSPSQRQKNGWQASKEEDHPAFPRYDARRLDLSQPANQLIEIRDTRSEPRGFAGELQLIINQTRKYEQRLNSLQKSRQQRLAQWDKYEADIKKSYQAERERHQKALAKIEEDLSAVKQQYDQVQEQMGQAAVAAGFARDAPMEQLEAADIGRMFGMPVAAPDVSMEDIMLARAMRRERAAATSTQSTVPLSSAPEPPGLAAPPMDTGPSLNEGTAHIPDAATTEAAARGLPSEGYMAASPDLHRARAAPYPPSSPSHMRPAVGAARHPGQRDMSHTRVPTNQEAPRHPIKEDTKAPPARPDHAGGIQQKLEERRQRARGNAMQPFTGKPRRTRGRQNLPKKAQQEKKNLPSWTTTTRSPLALPAWSDLCECLLSRRPWFLLR